jgi:erythronate-4-phosphate dehydrogenase
MEALGVKCLLNDPLLSEQNPNADYVDLDRIIEADIISLHVPLTIDGKYPSYNLVNETFLNKLKPDVILINTSRGQVIDEAALLSFKEANSKATLILDVWCNEPLINIDLLRQTFIGTPHIAGYSYDGKLKATRVLAEALQYKTGVVLNEAATSHAGYMTDTIEYNDESSIQFAVMRTYDVRSDVIAFESVSDLAPEGRGMYFDSLRKHYPIRREFTNRQINTKNLNEKMKQSLQNLGFKVGMP